MNSITRQTNGAIQIIDNDFISYIVSPQNIQIRQVSYQDPRIIIKSTDEGLRFVFLLADIDAINGAAPPATVADTLDLLANSVFTT